MVPGKFPPAPPNETGPAEPMISPLGNSGLARRPLALQFGIASTKIRPRKIRDLPSPEPNPPGSPGRGHCAGPQRGASDGLNFERVAEERFVRSLVLRPRSRSQDTQYDKK